MNKPQMKYFDFQSMSEDGRQICIQNYRLALTQSEALKIQSLLKRPPTLAECILWGIQGSEHCSYKSTRQYLKTLCTHGPNVISGAKEDAGIVWIAKDKQGYRYCVAISHESHNHPSQVVPFEGAATGIGGNVRDVSCMGAEVIANADSLRFGNLAWIADEVVKGVASYSNAIGVPNIAGDIFYHNGFNDNCLVTVVSLGIVREDHIIHSYAPKNAAGYALILVGKPTDHSGFGGASFASTDLDETNSDNNRGAVQEPNAFLGRLLLKTNLDLFKKLQQKNCIDRVGFKDLGAGGIACASIEIAESGGYGADIFLENVPVSQKNLDPSVILCAETQERYLWVVPDHLIKFILDHYNTLWQLPAISAGAKASVIGKIREDDQYVVHFQDQQLISAKASDITQGILYDRPTLKPKRHTLASTIIDTDLNTAREKVLTHSMCASTENVYEQYDKQVQGRTIVERGVADAGVLQPFNSSEYPVEIQKIGIALSVGCNPLYGKIDPYWTSVNAVINCVAKVIAVGATPWCLTDCLCFGNPENPEQMWELVSSIRGLKEASEKIGLLDYENTPLPIIAGNVSLYNQNKNGNAIPASPMISVLGKMDDVENVITPQLKFSDSILICLGKRTDDLGGSVYAHALNIESNDLPKPDLLTFRLYAQQFLELHAAGFILSAKAIEHGGIFEATSVMEKNSEFKAILSTEKNLSETAFWCNEMPGWVLEISQSKLLPVETQLHKNKIDYYLIGKTK